MSFVNFEAETLSIIFIGLMGFSILVYALLDGYDLGIGILLPLSKTVEAEQDRNRMLATIGPFWDANETWLVLAVGLMLIAFPTAHSAIMYKLYLPVFIMLLGLILRGVAFDFRAKAAVDLQAIWDKLFKLGSVITALSQGYMLGMYVVGFETSLANLIFSILSAIGVVAAYCYIGSAWLILKTEARLQKQAVTWCKYTGRICLLGIIAVSVVNPMINPQVFDKWFTMPFAMFVLLIPVLTLVAFIGNDILLSRLPKDNDRHAYWPILISAIIFTLCFSALAFSYFPYIIPNKMTIWQAASSKETLNVILTGVIIVVPIIMVYTVYAYYVFRGKASNLNYY